MNMEMTAIETRYELADVATDWLSGRSNGGWDWAQTLRTARQSISSPLRRAVLRVDEHLMQSKADLVAECDRLSLRLAEDGHKVEISPLVEFDVCHDLFERIERACILVNGLNRHYAVIRVPRVGPCVVQPVVRRIRAMGLIPVVAGVEDAREFRKQPGLVDEVRRAGGLIRLSADAIDDPLRLRFCRRLILAGKCDLVGSANLRSPKKPLALQDEFHFVNRRTSVSLGIESAKERVARWAGNDVAYEIFHLNANRFFEGELYSPTSCTAPRLRRWLRGVA